MASAVTRKWDADQITRPSRTSSACGVSWRTPSVLLTAFETSRSVCTVTIAYCGSGMPAAMTSSFR